MPDNNSHSNSRDTYYAEPNDMLVDFTFDEKVANVFPDMIRRSVPGYDALIMQLSVFARQFARPATRLYDLGCSTGASSLALLRGCRNVNDVTLIAVDNAAPMLDKARVNLNAFVGDNTSQQLQLMCADIRDVTISNASIVCLNFTLQFIAPEHRDSLLAQIYHGLNPGAVLILSEKLSFASATEQQFMERLHLSFKRENGYSELEIAQKRSALENVLIPETLDTHRLRLAQCGFDQVFLWFQNFNFCSIAAIKS